MLSVSSAARSSGIMASPTMVPTMQGLASARPVRWMRSSLRAYITHSLRPTGPIHAKLLSRCGVRAIGYSSV